MTPLSAFRKGAFFRFGGTPAPLPFFGAIKDYGNLTPARPLNLSFTKARVSQ